MQLVNSPQTDAKKDLRSDDTMRKGTTSLSGKVVDTDRNAVPGLELTIKPVEFNPNNDVVPRTPISSWKRVETDKQGGFSFANIDSVPSQLVMLPEGGSDFEIVTLEIGDMTFYFKGSHRNLPNWFGKPTFAIEPGMPLENIVVTVKPAPMRIRGRVLLRDGTPLANAFIDLTVRQRIRDTFLFFFTSSSSESTSGGGAETDSQGYFVYNQLDEAAEYSVLVRYEGASAKSRWFRLKEGQHYDKLVLRLKDVEKHRKKQNERVKKQQAVWTVNPENGHAYKKIQCDSWNDAKTKAAAEDAYLVSINSEAEQRWLEARFAENLFYWIGLKTSQKNTSLQWINGDPVTYENWIPSQESGDMSTNDSNVHIAMEFFSKRWMAISSNSPFFPAVKHAILEKEDVPVVSNER